MTKLSCAQDVSFEVFLYQKGVLIPHDKADVPNDECAIC